MSSTPLFDQISRRAEAQALAGAQPAPAVQPASPARPHPATPTDPTAAGTPTDPTAAGTPPVPPTAGTGAAATGAATTGAATTSATTPSATVRPATASSQDAAPASPLGASAVRTVVPSALVAEINDIPARIAAGVRREVALSAEQLALVEELGDTLIRVVVDALATELDRIASARAVRG